MKLINFNSIYISISLILSLINNIESVLSQHNYTKFVNNVCNVNGTFYDQCSCNLATWSLEKTNNITCFTSLNCPYDINTNEFCSGNGICNFQIGECECDREYGSFDCSQEFEETRPTESIMILMIIIAGILLLFSLLQMIWVHLYRDVKDVKAMSVVFTHLTLVGCAFISSGTIVIGIGYDDFNCVILEWLQFIGICMVISCALLKAYRIAVIFHKGAANVSPSDLTDSTLLKYFTVMMIVDIFFLSMYTIFNELDGGSYPRYLDDQLLIEIRCNSNALTMISYSLLVAWQLLLLLFVLKYGNETRSAAKAFKETKCIYVGSNIGSIFFIAFGILVLFTTNYTLQIVVRGYGSLVVVMMTIGLLFMPKWKSVYAKTEEEIVEDDEGNKMTEKEFAKKREFETQVKEPNGKDLLLLLDVLVRELAYRTDMKMIQIELKSIDLLQCLKLMDDIKVLIPQPLQDQYYRQQQEKEPLQVKQMTIASTSTHLVSDNEEDINNGKTETHIPNAEEIKSQKSKSKSSRNRANSLDSDSRNIQSSPEENNENNDDQNGYDVNNENNNNNNLSLDKDENNPIEMQKLNSNEPDDE